MHAQCLVTAHRHPCQVAQCGVDRLGLGSHPVALHDRAEIRVLDLECVPRCRSSPSTAAAWVRFAACCASDDAAKGALGAAKSSGWGGAGVLGDAEALRAICDADVQVAAGDVVRTDRDRTENGSPRGSRCTRIGLSDPTSPRMAGGPVLGAEESGSPPSRLGPAISQSAGCVPASPAGRSARRRPPGAAPACR